MKTKINISLLAILSTLLSLTACNDYMDTKPANEYDFTQILNGYVDSTVVKTYSDMKDSAILLYRQVVIYKNSGLQSDLDSACTLWRATRLHWEQSESFLFGPAAYQSLDPLLDSWPLDKAQLDQVLAGNQELTADYVRNSLGAVLRGFHTIEYLLFREGAARNTSDVTTREKDYLAAVSEVLRDDCIKLWALWHGSAGITGIEAEVLETLGVDPGVGYGYEFKNAGKTGSRYISQKDAIEEIIQGSIDIADEVANGKLADPFNANNPLLVESWFSWNSLDDFQNNIRSIENSFLGGVNNSAVSLEQFINSKDETLVPLLKTKINTAIAKIDAIPAPFRNNLDKANEIQAAMNAVNDLASFLQEDIKPLLE